MRLAQAVELRYQPVLIQAGGPGSGRHAAALGEIARGMGYHTNSLVDEQGEEKEGFGTRHVGTGLPSHVVSYQDDGSWEHQHSGGHVTSGTGEEALKNHLAKVHGVTASVGRRTVTNDQGAYRRTLAALAKRQGGLLLLASNSCPKCGSKKYSIRRGTLATCAKCGENFEINAGGPGSGRHSAGGGHFVEWNHSDPATHAFGKAYLGKVKEGGYGPKTDAFGSSTKTVGGKSGFGGSGHTVYEHGGNTFRVDRYANGKGFWGADHAISKAEPQLKKND